MRHLELSNFVCKFGEKKVLEDYYEQIVLPAFNSNERKKWRNNLYYLYEVTPGTITTKSGKTHKVIYGRLAKNTLLVSKQVEGADGKMVRRTKRLKSSPTSFFILYVEIHKLVYVTEMGFAPSLSDFEYTVAWLLKNAHREYLKQVQKLFAKKITLQNKKPGEKKKPPTLKELRELYPPPSLTITSIGTKDSLSEFINSYGKLKRIVVDLLPVNEEKDKSKMYRILRSEMDDLGSEKTSVTHQNKEGMNKASAIEELETLVTDANHKIKTYGTDPDGNVQDGTNENFKIKRPVSELPEERDEAKEFLHGEIIHMIEAKAIPWPLE